MCRFHAKYFSGKTASIKASRVWDLSKPIQDLEMRLKESEWQLKEFREKIASLEDSYPIANNDGNVYSSWNPSALTKIWYIVPIIVDRYSLSPNEVIELQLYMLNLFRPIFTVGLWWMWLYIVRFLKDHCCSKSRSSSDTTSSSIKVSYAYELSGNEAPSPSLSNDWSVTDMISLLLSNDENEDTCGIPTGRNHLFRSDPSTWAIFSLKKGSSTIITSRVTTSKPYHFPRFQALKYRLVRTSRLCLCPIIKLDRS